jgi:hypothetical protein
MDVDEEPQSNVEGKVEVYTGLNDDKYSFVVKTEVTSSLASVVGKIARSYSPIEGK